MKRLLNMAIMLIAVCASAAAQKSVYIPDEWKWNKSLYAESDPDAKATWSKTRSVENDDLVIFWDNGYGKKKPSELPKSDFYYVDLDDLMAKCQAFYDLEYHQLGFVDTLTTNLNKYKMMVLILHSSEWACYGSGYDFEVNALWVNPAPCHPVGHSVAHEVGHSFHYMCYAEASGHNHTSSQTIGTGFHLPIGSGQTIWEQTAQWQANQSYPELMYDQSIGIFRNSHNLAFTHEWHRYQSYWFHYFLCQHYGDIRTIADIWNQPMQGAADFNQALMANKNLSVRDLYKLYFDYASRCATWDFDACVPYRNGYIGDFNFRCVQLGEREYQVALASCPQGTGFNIIPLQVPEAGTTVTTHLTGLRVGALLQEADPGEFLNGDSFYEKVTSRRYNSITARSSRGFRMGYVALMQDGTRQYFAEDSVYCQGTSQVTEDYAFTLPEGVSRLWLVISPALKTYLQHKWDDKIDGDDQWPYSFSLEGTDLGSQATIYVSPTIDGRDVADATFTYDVTFPVNPQAYLGTTVTVGGQAAATLGTAFQMQLADIGNKMQNWTSTGPSADHIMFYGVNANGKLANSGSTANGYGHWFNAAGNVCDWNSGYIYSEFTPSSLSFYIGQFPGKCKSGSQYTVSQALRYRTSDGRYAQATFVFRVTVGPDASVTLAGIDYANPTGIRDNENRKSENWNIYDLNGRQINAKLPVLNSQLRKGLYIINGCKVVIR